MGAKAASFALREVVFLGSGLAGLKAGRRGLFSYYIRSAAVADSGSAHAYRSEALRAANFIAVLFTCISASKLPSALFRPKVLNHSEPTVPDQRKTTGNGEITIEIQPPIFP